MRIAVFVAWAFVALAGRAAAERVAFVIDETNTTITFRAPFMEMFELTGEFHDFDGYAVLDEDAPAATETEVTVRTEALTTDDGRWEEKLRSEDFFASETFPEMTFRSAAFEANDDGTGVLEGDLTMRGITRRIGFAVEYEVRRQKGGKAWLAFHGTTAVDRRDFGIVAWEGVLGDTVSIEIVTDAVGEAVLQSAAPD